MLIDKLSVEKIAHLARIELSDEDSVYYQNALSQIIQWIDIINTVDTQNITPMAHPFEALQPTRADETRQAPPREQLLFLAPKASAGFYLVPQVIE